jgi:2'-5' RNA ligase
MLYDPPAGYAEPMPNPLILTLGLDPATFALMDGLRRTHFPPERNVVPAHVTLFHDLPGEELTEVERLLAAVSAETPAFEVRFPKVRFMGKGVSLDVDAPELLRLRRRLADEWASWLTPQDRQPYRPHLTIQNKVSKDEARLLFEQMSAGWSPVVGCGEGLRLWHYRGGPWEPAGAFGFL